MLYVRLQTGHVQRFESRRIAISSAIVNFNTASSGLAALERALQRLRLRHGAREPVQDEPLLGVRLLEAILTIRTTRSSGTYSPRSMYAARLDAERRAFLDVLAQDVARRDLRDAVALRQTRGLRPLARARRPEQHEPHGAAYFRKPS